MYGKALTPDDIKSIENEKIEVLQDIAFTAYKTLIPIQKSYCDEYLQVKIEKQAAINCGYSAHSIAGQLDRLRNSRNVCLYISVKQELDKREQTATLKAENETVEADKELLMARCREIINDPEAKRTEVLYAIDLLAKLHGVYKESPNAGKNKTFSVKKPSKPQNN